MKKLIRKILFIYNIVRLGGNLASKCILFIESIRIQKNFYVGGKTHPFVCKIKNNNRTATVAFPGTLDDMHALTEIFIERCYDPKINNVKKALDLGANIGLASIWMWTEFPGCTIFAYEPNPKIYSILVKNLSPLSNTHTFNLAISDIGPTITFYISDRSFSSSIHKEQNRKEFSVRTKSLDQAIDDIGGNVDLVKIDIEGEEFQTLENSKKLIYVDTIVGEMHVEKSDALKENFISNLSKTHSVKVSGQGKSLFIAHRK